MASATGPFGDPPPPRRRAFAALAALFLLAAPAAPPPASSEEEAAIQRYMAHLYLGDSLEDVQRIYPPAQEWPSYVEPRGRVTRIRVERSYAKSMPLDIDTLWLGMKKGRLVEIQLVYDVAFTRRKSVEALAADLALIYGEPKFGGGKYWWNDDRTVLRVFYAEVPVLRDGAKATELRTSLQLMEQGLFKRTD